MSQVCAGLSCSGDGDFGGKTVTELARAFVEASQQNLVLFQPPQVTFAFFDGITESIAGEART